MRISTATPCSIIIIDNERGLLSGTREFINIEHIKEYVKNQFIGRKCQKVSFTVSQNGKSKNLKIIAGTIKKERKELKVGSWFFSRKNLKTYKITEIKDKKIFSNSVSFKQSDIKICTLKEKRILDRFLS